MKKTFGRLLSIALAACLIGGLLAKIPSAQAAASQAYTFKSVRTGGGGGFIVDVIFNQKQQNLIYAKTDMGGVYRWNQSNSTWTQLLNWVSTDDWNWTGAESVATDPVDPNRLYIAAGTYTNSWAPTNGVILRSTDQGNTFSMTQMSFKMGGNMPGRGMGERLAIDPNKNSILYFGARNGNGLWKSTDYGVTWAKVTNFPDTGPFVGNSADTNNYLNQPIGIPWVIFDPATGTSGNATQTIYVGVAENASGKANIYRSTDTGATWAAIPGEPTCTGTWGGTVTCTDRATWTAGAANSYSGGGIGYLPHEGKLNSQGTLYVTYSDWEGPYNGGHGTVYKYVPSTNTWTNINPTTAATNYQTYGSQYFGYGGLGVDMLHPGTIVVTGQISWWPQGMMFRTTDGGANWTPAWTYTPTQVFTMDISNAPWLNFGSTNASYPVPNVNIGWMMEGLNIDPFNSDRMMYGTGATLYATNNLTAWGSGTTVTIKSTAVGIEEASVQGLISPPSGTPHLFSVMGDIGGFRHDNLDAAPSTMYTVPYAGSYQSIDFAELSPTFMVRAGHGDSSATPPANHSTAFTYDGGLSWFAGNNDIGGATGGGTIAAAANASRVLWAPSGGAVSYSTDNGNSWIASTGIPAGAYVASDRVNPSKFYGLANGTFYVSTNAGVSFTSTMTGLPTSGTVRAVAGYEGDVWVTTNQFDSSNNPVATDGIYHSTNNGTSFTKLSGVTFADVIGFGMAAPGQTYPAIYTSAKIDGVRGIYRSDDGAASWVKITDAQHQFAYIQTITGDPRIYGRIYFGTNGLGAFYGDPAGNPPATNTPTRTPTGSTLTATRTATRTNTPTGFTATPTRTATRSSTPSRTSTRTSTPTGFTLTPSRTATRTNTATGFTNTPSRTPTRTNTATGFTNTPSRTPTRSNTPSITPTGGAPCSPVTATITAPFPFDGAGTFCWQSSNLGSYINSWNLATLTVNGVDFTNKYAFTSALPAKINGYWYVYYVGNYSWSHFEAK